ncbi:triose-phosphate isomerase [Campylobacter concisus]|uniref:triose-phosphate isomerase n=1 Tax=Campylobacter concisus TaxID=199 RepID=UPI0018A9EC97|nr:triose-phosphate isomerase [Campylobacter concisus]QPH99897.1 triose-phosphate isomerase [Campylobacter concisus]QPI01689.1 triose-phosphate isomerase [Campylobacter concisus]
MRFLANLKCNHTRESFAKYAQILDANLSANDDVTVFPPFSALDGAAHKFKLGAQNFYPCESGAHTGEIGKAMLDEFGVKSVLIGHSERRELGESEELLRVKFDFAAKAGWQIVYCIGENLSVKEAGGTKEFLAEQLKNIDLGHERLLIAYEPIWAIGTGKSASAEQIEGVLNFIREQTSVPLLYGGSVNAANIADIAGIKSCDGVLVGTASWDANNFLNLIRVVS